MNRVAQAASGAAVRVQDGRTADAPESATRQALALEATALAGRWQRAARGHLAFAAGCSCSIGSSIDLRDLDDFILDYLRHKFAGAIAVVACIETHAGASTPPSLQSLLRAIASGRDGLEPAQAAALLRETGGSIASVEEQHL